MCSPALSAAISQEQSGSNQRAARQGEKASNISFRTAEMGDWGGETPSPCQDPRPALHQAEAGLRLQTPGGGGGGGREKE